MAHAFADELFRALANHALGGDVARTVEQIQRKFQVRGSTPENNGGPRTDPGWREKEGTASGIKNKEGAQSLGTR